MKGNQAEKTKRENVCEPACASARMGLVKCQRECQAPLPGRDEQSGGGTRRGMCKASWSVPTSKLATASSIVPSSEGWSAAAASRPDIEANDGIGAHASIEYCGKAICVRAQRESCRPGQPAPAQRNGWRSGDLQNAQWCDRPGVRTLLDGGGTILL